MVEPVTRHGGCSLGMIHAWTGGIASSCIAASATSVGTFGSRGARPSPSGSCDSSRRRDPAGRGRGTQRPVGSGTADVAPAPAHDSTGGGNIAVVSSVPAELAGIGPVTQKVRVVSGFDPLKAGLGPEEYFLMSRIDGSQTIRDIILATGLPVDRAIQIVTKLRTIGALLL